MDFGRKLSSDSNQFGAIFRCFDLQDCLPNIGRLLEAESLGEILLASLEEGGAALKCGDRGLRVGTIGEKDFKDLWSAFFAGPRVLL